MTEIDSTMRAATIIGSRRFTGRTAVEVECGWCDSTHWMLDAAPGAVVDCLVAPGRPMFVAER